MNFSISLNKTPSCLIVITGNQLGSLIDTQLHSRSQVTASSSNKWERRQLVNFITIFTFQVLQCYNLQNGTMIE